MGAGGERKDPVEVLEDQAKNRVPELVPIRYGRMLASPFTFYRGAAAIMAMDLDKTPQSGLRGPGLRRRPPVELRRLRRPGPPPGAGRQRLRRDPSRALGVGRQAPRRELRDRRARSRLHPKQTRAAVLRTVRAYREAMREFAAMGNLEVWYARLDVETLLADMARSPTASR